MLSKNLHPKPFDPSKMPLSRRAHEHPEPEVEGRGRYREIIGRDGSALTMERREDLRPSFGGTRAELHDGDPGYQRIDLGPAAGGAPWRVRQEHSGQELGVRGSR